MALHQNAMLMPEHLVSASLACFLNPKSQFTNKAKMLKSRKLGSQRSVASSQFLMDQYYVLPDAPKAQKCSFPKSNYDMYKFPKITFPPVSSTV